MSENSTSLLQHSNISMNAEMSLDSEHYFDKH